MMKKEGHSAFFNSDDGKVNSRLFFLILFVIGATIYLSIFANSLGDVVINLPSGENISNFSV
ncbi:MAG: hypothetical protein AAB658_02045 [Chloroflexota bacterium]